MLTFTQVAPRVLHVRWVRADHSSARRERTAHEFAQCIREASPNALFLFDGKPRVRTTKVKQYQVHSALQTKTEVRSIPSTTRPPLFARR